MASHHLLTLNATKYNKEPWVDDDQEMPSHGTCTAGKILGTRFGASKQATLVVVRLYDLDALEFEEALELIRDDIKANPERRKKSVISMALTMGQDWEAPEIRSVSNFLRQLFDMDVPFVCISGNIEDESDDTDVDEWPALLEGPDMPLIVVGSVNSDGERSDFSQAGLHVTTHALGEDIQCLPRDGEVPIEEDGTSYGIFSFSTLS